MKKRILILDDDPPVAKLIGHMVSLWGYDALVCIDSKRAINVAKSKAKDIAVIISDVNMPDMNGFEVIQEIQKASKTAMIPVIFLTGQSGEEDMQRGMALNAQAYLAKPVVWDDLHATLDRIMNLVGEKK